MHVTLACIDGNVCTPVLAADMVCLLLRECMVLVERHADTVVGTYTSYIYSHICRVPKCVVPSWDSYTASAHAIAGRTTTTMDLYQA
jgi:hypothetical protein